MKLKQNNRQRSINEHFGADRSVRISYISSSLSSSFSFIPKKRTIFDQICIIQLEWKFCQTFVSGFLRETLRKQTVILNQEAKKEKLSPRLTWLTKTRYVKSASVFIAALNLREKKPASKRGAISVPLGKLSECYSPFSVLSFFLVERPY